MVGYMWIYTLKTWILEETCRVIEISLENMESKICENVVTTFSPPIRVGKICECGKCVEVLAGLGGFKGGGFSVVWSF